MNTTCSGPECVRPIVTKKSGLCRTHYQQERSGRSLTILPPLGTKPCSIEVCERPAASRQLCAVHASVASRYKLMTSDFKRLLEARHCYGCDQTIPTSDQVHFDHDHGCCPGNNTCGRCLRGTLCRSCNITLGKYRDHPKHRPDLLAYIRDAPHVATEPWSPIYKK